MPPIPVRRGDAVTADVVARSPVLTVDGVRKAFGHGPPWHRRRVGVLRGASLEVRQGELVGLVGENGSGKSTLMQVIVGLLGRDGGSLAVPGRLGYCPQQSLLWDKLTVAEHLELFATAYGLAAEQAVAARDRLLDELGFAGYLGYRVEELSGGTRQKLNLALALMHDPQLLLLDEPYAGFDWETYLRFWEMAERRRADGMGILIVSHLLAERQRLTRIYELREGRLRGPMTRTFVFAREQLRAPFTLALLVAIPALFVVSAAGVLSDFASALGGSLAGEAAVALSAGWAAAFISGALGFFQAASSRGADRRLALAGLGPARVAASRVAASVLLAVVAAAAAFAALVLRVDVAHPWHAAERH